MIVEVAVEDEAWSAVPDLEVLARTAALAALAGHGQSTVSLLFADDAEVARLNSRWRGKSGPTNVLSFPAAPGTARPDGSVPHLGDIVLAAGVVGREAAEQGKPMAAHMAHLIVHGVLHLLGFDHGSDRCAGEMEAREIALLRQLGIADPYDRN